MTKEQAAMLVLKDANSNYYLLSHEMLEQARVPGERGEEVERFFTGQDTRGFELRPQSAAVAWLIGSKASDLTVLGWVASSAKPGMETTEEFGSWRDIEGR